MKQFVLIALLAASPTFSQSNDAANGATVASAKAKLTIQLKDPDSAQFTGIVVAAEHGLVCGWVNAKNSFGGYVGYRPFFVMGDVAVIRDPDSADELNNHSAFAAGWALCVPPTGERFGDKLLELKFNIAKVCQRERTLFADKPQLAANCEQRQEAARAWLQGHPTSQLVVLQCRTGAFPPRSYTTAKSCVEDGEASIVFRRGPPVTAP